MSVVTILGAGAMGSAIATPLCKAGNEVRLWGTHLDDALLDACDAGLPHPRTGVLLAAGTALYRSRDIAAALDGADCIVLAVASVGVVGTVRLAAPHWSHARALLLTSKGFSAGADGVVRLLPDAVRRTAGELGVGTPALVAVGGPCKANEVAAGRWTAAVFASADTGTAAWAAGLTGTQSYRAEVSEDERGVEVTAPLKNVYAIALGIADGVGDATGEPHHNLKSAIFAQALAEMALLAELLGGRATTAFGLAGAGDLEVTGLSGRNKVYGARVGAGEAAATALDAMVAGEQTVEGVPAAELAATLVDQQHPEAWQRLPLLFAVRSLLAGSPDPVGVVAEAVLPQLPVVAGS